MTQDERKALVGRAAIEHVTPGDVIGVGTGSTVDHFIAALAAMPVRIRGAVSSSERSSKKLLEHGIPILDANDVERLSVYVDGADEIDHAGNMVKGGGGALTREKIVADLATRFVCIADDSKLVDKLGKFSISVEVIPMAAAQIARRLRGMGGDAILRAGTTDNGCRILDVHGLSIADPLAFEREVDTWPGVVTVGIFARNKADVCMLGTADGVRTLTLRGAT